MIIINIEDVDLTKYHKTIKCWFLRKFDGGKSYKSGYHCGDNTCGICTKKGHKMKGLPLKFIVFFKKNLDKIIIGNPKELVEINRSFNRMKLSKKHKKNIKEFMTQTGYENWFQPTYSKALLDEINIDTCVYCNRNYTLNIVDSHVRAELDHWFPKEKFFILALSLQNLISSCHSCNHIKGSSPSFDWDNALDLMTHPYLDEKEEGFNFSYEYDESLDQVEFKINPKIGSKKTEETLKFNKIFEIYNAHANKELKDLIDLRYKYSDTFLEIIDKNFGGIMKKAEAYRIVFGIESEEKDYHKRPFSKFKKDILEELLSVKSE
jgi:hypothetical protein